MTTARLLTATILASVLAVSARAEDLPLTIWYAKPAAFSTEKWNSPTWQSLINEALPIGSGRIGALIQGVPENELLRLNEISLWSGTDTKEGDYQALADLTVSLPGSAGATDYRRDLDLTRALAHVTYQAGGVHYQREYFASHAANVLAVRFTADKPGSFTGTVALKDGRTAPTVAEAQRLTCAGAMADNGLRYETQVMILNEGGTQQANGTGIDFKDCDALTLIVGAGTDYAMDFDKGYRGEPPHAAVARQVQAAAQQPYDALRAAHVQDYQALFQRCALDLGPSSAQQRALPTDQRKKLASKVFDPEMEQLIFQYGRYLMISCSRPGTLPANLQGLWNDSNTPAWHSDYHFNVNVQMNYWPVEVTNLAECHRPLLAYLQSQLPAWRQVTLKSKDLATPDGKLSPRGWAVRTSANIYGETDWNWDKTANAWFCLHFWEHFAFGRDKTYLAQVAYPVMKETYGFWEDHLQALPDGRLVVTKGRSPEHGPSQDGVSYNQEIVWDLFNNYVDAADALGIDKDYRNRIAALRDKLVVPGIGSWGQLLEWMTELHDPKNPELDTPNDHHRHTSHLFAVFPGRQITLDKTPALAAAAKVSLKARGNQGEVKEWSYAWRTALYARLRDGEDAQDQVMHFLGTTTLNLFGYHGPVQLDGNFGVTGAIAEMLVQSHEGEIDLLPALPKEWANGSVSGLCARGGFEVSLEWANGRLTRAVVRDHTGTVCKVRYGTRTASPVLSPGQSIALDGTLAPR